MNKPVKKAAPPKTKAFTKPKSSIDSLFESLESGTSEVSQNLLIKNAFPQFFLNYHHSFFCIVQLHSRLVLKNPGQKPFNNIFYF